MDNWVFVLALIIMYVVYSTADFLDDYLFLTVGRVGGATTDIQQKVVEVGEYEKREKLTEILTSMG